MACKSTISSKGNIANLQDAQIIDPLGKTLQVFLSNPKREIHLRLLEQYYKLICNIVFYQNTLLKLFPESPDQEKMSTIRNRYLLSTLENPFDLLVPTFEYFINSSERTQASLHQLNFKDSQNKLALWKDKCDEAQELMERLILWKTPDLPHSNLLEEQERDFAPLESFAIISMRCVTDYLSALNTSSST